MTTTLPLDPAVLDPTKDDEDNYFLGPIPSPRDEQISMFIRQWAQLGATARQQISASIVDLRQAMLLAFSERMASHAVRSKNREPILLGLFALGLDGWQGDWRDSVLLLPLHYDAAKKIGEDPDLIFDEAAKILPPNVGPSLVKFLKRAPADRSREAMGYEESVDADGFRYRRTW